MPEMLCFPQSETECVFIDWTKLHPNIHTRMSFTHSCPALCNLMDCSPSGSSVHEILQARILKLNALLSLFFIIMYLFVGLFNRHFREGNFIEQSSMNALLFSRWFSWPWNQAQVSCIAGRFFTIWATKEAQESQSPLWICLR